jgi:hypothetical protein
VRGILEMGIPHQVFFFLSSIVEGAGVYIQTSTTTVQPHPNMSSRASSIVDQQLDTVAAALRQLDGIVHIRSALQRDVFPLTADADAGNDSTNTAVGVDASAALTYALRASPLGVLATFIPTAGAHATSRASTTSAVASNAARLCGDLASELELDVGDALHHLQRAVARVREAADECAAKASELALLAVATVPVAPAAVPTGRAGRGGAAVALAQRSHPQPGPTASRDPTAAFEQWHDAAWAEAHFHSAARRLSDLAATLDDVVVALRWVVNSSPAEAAGDQHPPASSAAAEVLEVCDVASIASEPGRDRSGAPPVSSSSERVGHVETPDDLRQRSHAAMQRAAGLRILARHRESIGDDDGAAAGSVLTPRTAVSSFLNFVEVTRADTK